MTTASEEILSKYKETRKVVDKYGRIVYVRRLRPDEKIKVLRWAESDMSAIVMPLMVAAAVKQIDDELYAFPKSASELNAVLNKLDDAIEDVNAEWVKFFITVEDEAEAEGEKSDSKS